MKDRGRVRRDGGTCGARVTFFHSTAQSTSRAGVWMWVSDWRTNELGRGEENAPRACREGEMRKGKWREREREREAQLGKKDLQREGEHDNTPLVYSALQ
jgi:hypothetical protein